MNKKTKKNTLKDILASKKTGTKKPKKIVIKTVPITNKPITRLTEFSEIKNYVIEKIHSYFGTLAENQKLDPHLVISFEERPNPELWKFLYKVAIGDIKIGRPVLTLKDLLAKIQYFRSEKALQTHFHNQGGFQITLPYSVTDIEGQRHIFSIGKRIDSSIRYSVFINYTSIILKKHYLQIEKLTRDEQVLPYQKQFKVSSNIKNKALGKKISFSG